jgi:hypothetical protein
LLVFAAGFAVHEVCHLLTIYALGAPGRFVVRPWPLALLPVSIPGIHAQPDHELGPARQAVVNFAGPAGPAAALMLAVIRARQPVWRAALAGNVLVLTFYAVIEVADVGFDVAGLSDPRFLISPEFNYGVPLAVLLVASGWAVSRSG